MPSPLFDDMQIANALRNEALPASEHLADNSLTRDRALRRFDRDDPPPYVSSTEDDDEDIALLAPRPVDSTMLDELNRLLEEPLDDDQRDSAAWHLGYYSRAYNPGTRYDREAKFERDHIKRWSETKANNDTRDYFVQYGPARKGRAGRERLNIIARRNIKRRWQKLGVWNHEWGIPDRENDPQPNDNTRTWKWAWQHGDATAEWHTGLDGMSQNQQHPSTRTVRLRQGMRRSEHSPVLPRSHLRGDASASQAESFITSRPWFMFLVEISEEEQSYSRLPVKTKRLYEGSTPANIRGLWEERGDWKADWRDPSRGETLIGWKWRHESPSPEPEDLSGLDNLSTFELTPSEVDALEAVPPPSPPTPRPAYIPPANPGTGLFGRDGPESPPAAPSEEPIEQPPPPQRRRRRRQPSTQPLRRSARIAAMTSKNPATSRVSKAPALPRRRLRKNTT